MEQIQTSEEIPLDDVIDFLNFQCTNLPTQTASLPPMPHWKRKGSQAQLMKVMEESMEEENLQSYLDSKTEEVKTSEKPPYIPSVRTLEKNAGAKLMI